MELFREIEKSFFKIEKLFTEATRLEFSQTLPGHLEKYNVGLGTMIRLKLLRTQSKLYKAFIQNGFSNRAEMSCEMIKEYYKHIHREK